MSSLQEQLARLQAPVEDPTTENDDSVFSRVKEILVKVTATDPESISPSTSLRDELSVSSLDVIEIAVRTETTFGIRVDHTSGFHDFSTVADIVKFIEDDGANSR